ncbi:MAG: class I SAM-dependent methyltransferase [Pseudomonadota bacterium]
MPSVFNARNADAYEIVMGRWSRRLAPQLVGFAGPESGERVLDVGCGTGSLTFAIAATGKPASVVGLDFAAIYVDAATARNQDPRVSFRQGDACALPFPDGAFDRSMTMLCLNFVTDPPQAVRELRRVTRSGGVMAAALWDVRGGFPTARLFLDVAAVLDPAAITVRDFYMDAPLTRPGELAAGLARDRRRTDFRASFTVRFDYIEFEDFWGAMMTGEGTMGKYLVGLPAVEQERIKGHCRLAYLCGEPDGPRSFATTALACRGVVP